MRIIADLHLHSKYSRATSPQMEVDTLSLWAQKKGIDIVATGDFTHPKYFQELKEKLVEDGTGLLKLKNNTNKTKFILSAEIACIYKDKGKCRRLHILILAPDFATVEKINLELNKQKFNLKSDGRPIIGFSAKNLAQLCFDANEKTLVIPAHIWTPWFGLLGSKSGYDSVEDCFEDLTQNIYAVETGLSSDPKMNWRLSMLDNLTLISNSDAHSPANIGREANVFDLNEVTYNEIYEILKNKNKNKFLYTVEFYPEEGRYHFDGHRNCKFVCSPQETINKYKNICPVCKKNLVLGVEYRVEELADREVNFDQHPLANRRMPVESKKFISYKSLVPLQEIIAECMQKGKKTKTVQTLYEEMLKKYSEFEILLDLNLHEITKLSNPTIAQAIDKVRTGEIIVEPGYDGEYGVVKIFSNNELIKLKPKQKSLI